VFGAETYHQEAVFSIASALARTADATAPAFDIQVFSDDPAPYRHLPVSVHPLDPQTRKEWSGPHNYHFRCKHVVVRKVLETAEKVILIDTDTFFHHDPMKLFERVRPDSVLCNAVQVRFGDCSHTEIYIDMAEELEKRGVSDDEMILLNSGVIGLCRENRQVLDRSIALMDEFYPRVPNAFNLEEFSLAVATYRTLSLEQCPDLIHHYWSRKQLFRAKVRAWLNKHADAPLSQRALADTANVTDKLPRPPTWQRLAFKSATRLVPGEQRHFVREVLYGCVDYPNEFDRACATAWWEKAFSNAEQRQKTPITAGQLQQWLDHWAVRRLLGSKRDAVLQHLLETQTRH
jgi:hypothetical protein